MLFLKDCICGIEQNQHIETKCLTHFLKALLSKKGLSVSMVSKWERIITQEGTVSLFFHERKADWIIFKKTKRI